MASSSMSIMHLSCGTVKDRTQLRLQLLDQIFFAIRIATEMIEALSYNVRCFGIPVEGPADVFCDNMLVVKNLSIPASVLHKMHTVIFYHRVKEDQSVGILQVGWILGEFNPADLFTKSTTPGNTSHYLVGSIFSNPELPIGDIQKA